MNGTHGRITLDRLAIILVAITAVIIIADIIGILLIPSLDDESKEKVIENRTYETVIHVTGESPLYYSEPTILEDGKYSPTFTEKETKSNRSVILELGSVVLITLLMVLVLCLACY